MKILIALLTVIFLLSCNNMTEEQAENNKTMKKGDEQFLKGIRVNKLENTEGFNFEIDINDKRISKTSPLLSDNKDLMRLQDRLPPSFLKFLKVYSNGLHMEIGNGLTIFPVGQVTGFWTDVLSITTETLSDSTFPSRDFVFFGMSGVDSEMFAFYTASKLDNGEYPIVWYNPGSIDGKQFVLLNSSFDKFVTMQYYLLKATDYSETFATYEEAENASSDKNAMGLNEKNWQNYLDNLYDTFDPTISKPNHDYYKSTISLTELRETIERTRNNRR